MVQERKTENKRRLCKTAKVHFLGMQTRVGNIGLLFLQLEFVGMVTNHEDQISLSFKLHVSTSVHFATCLNLCAVLCGFLGMFSVYGFE